MNGSISSRNKVNQTVNAQDIPVVTDDGLSTRIPVGCFLKVNLHQGVLITDAKKQLEIVYGGLIDHLVQDRTFFHKCAGIRAQRTISIECGIDVEKVKSDSRSEE